MSNLKNLLKLKQQGLINKAVIFLALLALVLSFTAKIEIHSTRAFGVVWNLGHVLAFYIWTYLCIKYNRKIQSLSFIKQFFLVFIAASLFGGMIELVQLKIGRSAELADIVSDLLGALLALSMHSEKRTQLKQLGLLSLKIVLILSILSLHRNVFFIPINEYYTHKQFPVLLDPLTPFEKTRVKKDGLKLVKASGEDRAYFEVKYLTTYYSGISIEFFPQDWGGYSYLLIDVFNPEQDSYNITCRIHDVLHEDGNEEYSDRFNQSFELFPGENKIKIQIENIKHAPANREIDLAKIASIGLFTIQLDEPKKMYLFKAELVKY